MRGIVLKHGRGGPSLVAAVATVCTWTTREGNAPYIYGYHFYNVEVAEPEPVDDGEGTTIAESLVAAEVLDDASQAKVYTRPKMKHYTVWSSAHPYGELARRGFMWCAANMESGRFERAKKKALAIGRRADAVTSISPLHGADSEFEDPMVSDFLEVMALWGWLPTEWESVRRGVTCCLPDGFANLQSPRKTISSCLVNDVFAALTRRKNVADCKHEHTMPDPAKWADAVSSYLIEKLMREGAWQWHERRHRVLPNPMKLVTGKARRRLYRPAGYERSGGNARRRLPPPPANQQDQSAANERDPMLPSCSSQPPPPSTDVQAPPAQAPPVQAPPAQAPPAERSSVAPTQPLSGPAASSSSRKHPQPTPVIARPARPCSCAQGASSHATAHDESVPPASSAQFQGQQIHLRPTVIYTPIEAPVQPAAQPSPSASEGYWINQPAHNEGQSMAAASSSSQRHLQATVAHTPVVAPRQPPARPCTCASWSDAAAHEENISQAMAAASSSQGQRIQLQSTVIYTPIEAPMQPAAKTAPEGGSWKNRLVYDERLLQRLAALSLACPPGMQPAVVYTPIPPDSSMDPQRACGTWLLAQRGPLLASACDKAQLLSMAASPVSFANPADNLQPAFSYAPPASPMPVQQGDGLSYQGGPSIPWSDPLTGPSESQNIAARYLSSSSATPDKLQPGFGYAPPASPMPSENSSHQQGGVRYIPGQISSWLESSWPSEMAGGSLLANSDIVVQEPRILYAPSASSMTAQSSHEAQYIPATMTNAVGSSQWQSVAASQALHSGTHVQPTIIYTPTATQMPPQFPDQQAAARFFMAQRRMEDRPGLSPPSSPGSTGSSDTVCTIINTKSAAAGQAKQDPPPQSAWAPLPPGKWSDWFVKARTGANVWMQFTTDWEKRMSLRRHFKAQEAARQQSQQSPTDQPNSDPTVPVSQAWSRDRRN